MKKLNNKGLTAIEVLVCFAIISVIVISMFNIVNNYKNKRDIESYKLDITTYKNTVTKTIYNDIIENEGIVSGSMKQNEENEIDNPSDAYKENSFSFEIYLTYKTGVEATIKILNYSRCFKYKRENGKKVIEAEDQDCTPDISENIDYEHSKYYISYTTSQNGEVITTEKFDLPKIYQLKYNDIMPNNISEEDDIFYIKIGLIHSDLGEKYDALNIITPNVSKYPGML